MITLVMISYFHMLLPEDGVKALMLPVKEAVPFQTDAYFCLQAAYFLAYLPQGIHLMLQFDFSKNPATMVMWMTDKFVPGTTPRKSIKELVEKSIHMSRLDGSHNNQLENYGIFAAGALSALQAGVDPSVVSDCTLLYCVARVGYMIFYEISCDNTLGFIRTSFWILCLGTRPSSSS